jgi:rhamnogalacturonyl hydrolase YesR
MWVGLEFLNSHALTGNEDYLRRAETIWSFLQTGRDSVLGDGIYWCEQKKFTKNTCSNASFAVFSLRLYDITSDEKYLKAGKDIYHWVKSTLRDPEDGLYYDNIRLDGSVSEKKYSYNSGQMLQAASLLYRITREESYLRDARELASACCSYFFEEQVDSSGKVKRMLKNENVWFTAVMLRGLEELYLIDGDSTYINDYKATLKWLWENGRDENGLFEDNRLGQSIRYGKNTKRLLTQAALVEMYARLATIDR